MHLFSLLPKKLCHPQPTLQLDGARAAPTRGPALEIHYLTVLQGFNAAIVPILQKKSRVENKEFNREGLAQV